MGSDDVVPGLLPAAMFRIYHCDSPRRVMCTRYTRKWGLMSSELTREQIRMARAALRWGVRDLGTEAGVAANTVNRFEQGRNATPETLAAIRKAFEAAGLVFIEADAQGGAGVRFRR